MTAPSLEAARRAAKKGVVVVRSSRVATRHHPPQHRGQRRRARPRRLDRAQPGEGARAARARAAEDRTRRSSSSNCSTSTEPSDAGARSGVRCAAAGLPWPLRSSLVAGGVVRGPGTAGRQRRPQSRPSTTPSRPARRTAEEPRRKLVKWNEYEGRSRPPLRLRRSCRLRRLRPGRREQGAVRARRRRRRSATSACCSRAASRPSAPITWTLGLHVRRRRRRLALPPDRLLVGVPEIDGHVFIGRTKEGYSMIKVMTGYSGWTMERTPMQRRVRADPRRRHQVDGLPAESAASSRTSASTTTRSRRRRVLDLRQPGGRPPRLAAARLRERAATLAPPRRHGRATASPTTASCGSARGPRPPGTLLRRHRQVRGRPHQHDGRRGSTTGAGPWLFGSEYTARGRPAAGRRRRSSTAATWSRPGSSPARPAATTRAAASSRRCRRRQTVFEGGPGRLGGRAAHLLHRPRRRQPSRAASSGA